jgi:predicted DNA-binding transcriptional regulator AlpA
MFCFRQERVCAPTKTPHGILGAVEEHFRRSTRSVAMPDRKPPSRSTIPSQTAFTIKTIDKRTVCEALGVSPATLARWVAERRFPRPIKASAGGKCRWRLSVVEDHLRQLERDADAT